MSAKPQQLFTNGHKSTSPDRPVTRRAIKREMLLHFMVESQKGRPKPRRRSILKSLLSVFF